MLRNIARSALALGVFAMFPIACGGGDDRTFSNSTGGTGGSAAGSGGANTGGSSATGGSSGSGGAAGSDASAGTGGTAGTGGSSDGGKTCSGAAECDDGLACNGSETCAGNVCKAGTNLADGTPCALVADGGVADSGVSYNCMGGECRATCKDDADCDDNDVCTGKETCNPTTKTCQSGTPLSCDDKNDCTKNECDKTSGCQYSLIDQDGDGHAATSLGSCGDDCNDNDKTIYTGAAELCDSKDNNCDGKTDEIAPLWYPDCDKDTFPPGGATGVQGCTAPATAPPTCPGGGWTAKAPGPGATDCFDTNAAVHPMTTAESNAAWSTKPIPGATTAVDYDYNCDGNEEKRFTVGYVSTSATCTYQCSGVFCYCSGTAGYTGAVPACGAASTYTSCSLGVKFCTRSTPANKTQECR